jgi:tetratricopeptide (TPR) repeat protein
MDIYTTVEEKYLQAVEELDLGELPKALQYFNAIIAFDAEYARAYYQVGKLYHYYFKDYKAAGYYYQRSIELDAAFPDAYEPYLELVVTLRMNNLVKQLAEKALLVPGVDCAVIYKQLGLHAEQQQQFADAYNYFRQAELSNAIQEEQTMLQEHLKRIKTKINSQKTMVYDLQG